MDAYQCVLRILHHTNADPSLAENQCLQSSSTHGYFRPRPRLCRQ